MKNFKKLKIAIIGTGNIGTDLLMKSLRSELISCTLFAGRNFNSAGLKKANSLGVPISDRGIEAIVSNPAICYLVFDCTSAQAHMDHWGALEKLGKFVIDMTPAKLGALCVPAINADECIADGNRNLNMITCGGQVSIPIAYAISQVHQNIEYIEVASSIASRSAGPATRANLDEYVETTQDALKKLVNPKGSLYFMVTKRRFLVSEIDMVCNLYGYTYGNFNSLHISQRKRKHRY
jgi:acetaldehyde dehydrogenase